jgi:hypothetical protein
MDLLERVVTVNEQGASASAQSDKHRDASLPPKISAVLAGVTISFDQDAPNQGYKPIDAVIKLKIDIPAGPGVNAGQQLCVITFGSQYVDKSGDPMPPMIVVQDEGNAGVPLWMISGVTASSFPIVALFALNPSTTARLRILVVSAASL